MIDGNLQDIPEKARDLNVRVFCFSALQEKKNDKKIFELDYIAC